MFRRTRFRCSFVMSLPQVRERGIKLDRGPWPGTSHVDRIQARVLISSSQPTVADILSRTHY